MSNTIALTEGYFEQQVLRSQTQPREFRVQALGLAALEPAAG